MLSKSKTRFSVFNNPYQNVQHKGSLGPQQMRNLIEEIKEEEPEYAQKTIQEESKDSEKSSNSGVKK